MRLIDTHTGEFLMVTSHFQVPYAILSHTWDPNGEQSYQDVCAIQASFWKGNTVKTIVFWARYLLELQLVKYSKAASEPSYFALAWMRFLIRLLRWGQRLLSAVATEESTYPTLLSDTRLSYKFRESCAICRDAGYRYLWFDACCIDKTSSSELSEAINSMYLWYKHSAMCFAFLSDVSLSNGEDITARGSGFRRSKWFTRGWTLQELLAPHVLIFVDREWQIIGTKGTMGTILAEITRIPAHYIRQVTDVRSASVAQRLSWVGLRKTTREEDEAYCLLGLFGINMPTLYGEGRYAFIRLQMEILKQEHDQSVFAWSFSSFLRDPSARPPIPCDPESAYTEMQIPRIHHLQASPTNGIYVGQMHIGSGSAALAVDTKILPAIHPLAFGNCSYMVRLSHGRFCKRLGIDVPPPVFTPTPFGMRTSLPLMPFDGHFLKDTPFEVNLPGKHLLYLAILACENGGYDVDGHLIGLICSLPAPTQEQNGDPTPILAGGVQCFLTHPDGDPGTSSIRTVVISPDDLKTRRDSIRVMDVHIPMLPSPLSMAATHHVRRGLSGQGLENKYTTQDAIRNIPVAIRLAPWCRSLLQAQGYTATDARPVPTAIGPPLCGFVLSKDSVELAVQCQQLMSVEKYGASVQVRLYTGIFRLPGHIFIEPMKVWGDWHTVTEVAPVVAEGCDSGGSRRTIHLTLKHHDQGVYMLGVEPL